MKIKIPCSIAALFVAFVVSSSASIAQDSVIAFWGWEADYDFSATDPSKHDFLADVDNTVSGNANNQVFLGDSLNLDDNGGGGFTSYTSPISGLTYAPTRTAKWDDLKGGGDNFDIGGMVDFLIDKSDGSGPTTGDFGNDALMYLTLDGRGFRDLSVRFDVEGTPGDLPATFDIFYRVGGSGTWFREAGQNNIALTFMDYPVADPDNMFADSGYHALNAALNNQSQIEIIIGDFAELGNGEMEIDNFEIIGTAIPEPTGITLIALTGLVAILRRRRL